VNRTAMAATGNSSSSQFKRRVLRLLGSEHQPRLRLSPAAGSLLIFLVTAAAFLPGILRSVALAQSDGNPRQRALHFPTDRAIGVISGRKAPPGDKDRLWIFGDEWRKVAEARGEVRLPADGEVRLDINKATAADPSGLDRLQPDDVQALSSF